MPTFPELELYSITYSIWRYWFLPKKALVYHHFSIIYDILFTFILLNSNFHFCCHTHATYYYYFLVSLTLLYCRKLDSIQCKFLLFCDIFLFLFNSFLLNRDFKNILSRGACDIISYNYICAWNHCLLYITSISNRFLSCYHPSRAHCFTFEQKSNNSSGVNGFLVD